MNQITFFLSDIKVPFSRTLHLQIHTWTWPHWISCSKSSLVQTKNSPGELACTPSLVKDCFVVVWKWGSGSGLGRAQEGGAERVLFSHSGMAGAPPPCPQTSVAAAAPGPRASVRVRRSKGGVCRAASPFMVAKACTLRQQHLSKRQQ